MIIEGLKILLLRDVEASMENYQAKVQRCAELYAEEYEKGHGEPPIEEFVYKPMGFGDIAQQVFWSKFKSAGECAGWLWWWGWHLAFIIATVITLVACRAATTVESIINTSIEEYDTAAWVVFWCWVLLVIEIILQALGGPGCIHDLTEKAGAAVPMPNETETEQSVAEEAVAAKLSAAAQKDDRTKVKTARRVTEIEERKVKVTEEGAEIETQ